MAAFRVIDADSHVEEPLEAWSYLEPKYEARRPFPITGENRPFLHNMNSFWYIDGCVYPKVTGQGVTIYATPVTMARAKLKPFSLESQTLSDPGARLRDMDAGGVDVQVIFPTVFLEPLSEDSRFETALMRSYNTWMAGVCKQKSDRLKWAGVLPMRCVSEAVEEVRRCKELGAVATAVYGTVGETLLSHEEFDPVWAEAERLHLPVCVHTGWCHAGLRRPFSDSYGAHVLGFTLPVLMGFYAFLGGGILDRFPRIKVAFLEAGVDWVPYLIERMDHYYHSETANNRPLPKHRATDYVRDCQVYFTCEAEEKLLPQVMEFVGEDRIMISADMPHGEAREGSVEEIKERNDLSQAVKQRILGDNAASFYGI
jgi:predicted TIM-barrel fold metal-dependent hydrolase